MSNNHTIARVMADAQAVARSHNHTMVTLEHVLQVAIDDEPTVEALTELRVNVPLIVKALNTTFENLPKVVGADPSPSGYISDIAKALLANAKTSGRDTIMMDFIVAILDTEAQDSPAIGILKSANADKTVLRDFCVNGMESAKTRLMSPAHDPNNPFAKPAEINDRSSAEAYMGLYAVNLVKAAENSKIDPLIGRATEVQQLVEATARRRKNNAILIGEAGVGKTAIVEGLALKIHKGEVPSIIKDAVIWSLDMGLLVAGTRFRGDFEERMKNVVKAMSFIPNSFLFIDETHTVLGAGSAQGSMDASNMLKPAMARGEIRLIGSTTVKEYQTQIEKDRALVRRFQRINVNEPSIEDSKLIVAGVASYYEEFHGIKFTQDAIDATVILSNRYINQQRLPDKAIDLLDRAGAAQRVRDEDKMETITKVEIEAEVSKVTGVPLSSINEGEIGKLARLDDNLSSNVFGQEEAVKSLSDAIFMTRAGLRSSNKTAGVMMFAGPTGVGKTEAAKTLADTLGIPLLRYDMSEYMDRMSVSKLIGAPPGYVGHDDGAGRLIEDIDKCNGYAVLLLDEFEKADPQVQNIFLQVFDNAELSSSAGDKTVSFRNTIIIMTTNVGAADAERTPIGFGSRSPEELKKLDLTKPLEKRFTPEFRNRLDKIVMFNRLVPSIMSKVTDKFIKELVALAAEREVVVEVNKDVRDYLSIKGYDAKMGARPLSRVIDDEIKLPLSRMMLIGELRDGGNVTAMMDGDDKIVLVTGAAPKAKKPRLPRIRKEPEPA